MSNHYIHVDVSAVDSKENKPPSSVKVFYDRLPVFDFHIKHLKFLTCIASAELPLDISNLVKRTKKCNRVKICLPVNVDITAKLYSVSTLSLRSSAELSAATSSSESKPYSVGFIFDMSERISACNAVSDQLLQSFLVGICAQATDIQYLSFLYHCLLDRPLDNEGFESKYNLSGRVEDWRERCCAEILNCDEYLLKNRALDALLFAIDALPILSGRF